MIALQTDQTALFGYGSLLSIRSLERTLGRTYDGPFVPIELKGWRRKWDAAMPNKKFYTETNGHRLYPETILYLNVARDAAAVLNGILFVVNGAELASFDERESIYDRIDITDAVPVTGGRAFVYVCRPEYRVEDVASPAQGAVRNTYIDIVETGLTDLGAAFRAGYEQSTDPVPWRLVIQDRL